MFVSGCSTVVEVGDVNRQETQIVESRFISDRSTAILSNMCIYSTSTVKSVNTMAVYV
jgi:hypothetical protein